MIPRSEVDQFRALIEKALKEADPDRQAFAAQSPE